jgi:tetratricopeptide (TPR) repeat protein
MPHASSPENRGSSSRRQPRAPGQRARRLRWTIALLTVGSLIGAAIILLVYRRSRPGPYRPGQEMADITRSLARDLPEDAPLPRFVDVTEAAGLGSFRTFGGERSSQLPEDMGSGAAWGDFDNDGDEDLFLVGAGGNLNRPPDTWAASELYENRGDGTFRRVVDFPETRIMGMAAAWADYDGNGWLDLVVTGYRSLLLFRNDGGRLTRDDRFQAPDGYWSSAAWGDFDNDRDPDLYVCGYVQYDEESAEGGRASLQYGRTVPFTLNPVSYHPERNLLFRNHGDGTFSEVAVELGVDNRKGRSLGALWLDFDQDGWLDLYVANDISDNVFYLNRQGRFEEISHAAWVADYRGAMGMAAGDWNRDGDDDLFITHWIAQENALYDSRLIVLDLPPQPGGEARQQPDRIAAGTDEVPVKFIDVADQRGLGQIALQFVGWGTEFADFDGDGWLDLVISNGSTFETEESPKSLRPMTPFFLWNARGEHFHDLAGLTELLARPHVGRGLALADYDADGDLDILRMLHGEGAQLLRTDMQSGNWVKIRLRGRNPNRPDALLTGEGTSLAARVGDIPLRRAVTGPSYLSQSSRIVHFGLGAATAIDAIEVDWIGGGRSKFENLAAGATWELIEGERVARRIESIGSEPAATPAGASSAPTDDRQRLLLFWEKQRAAMQAMKVEDNVEKAAALFREALAIQPDHEDSLYYLANCLLAEGDTDGAIEQLQHLIRVNSMSHRGLKRLGILLAGAAGRPKGLETARDLMQKAVAINPEETGALLVLGEIDLLQGNTTAAGEHLEAATRMNPRAGNALFLQAYLAWRNGDDDGAVTLLEKARDTRGEEWTPEGTTSEGDVLHKMHSEESPLSRFWTRWNGEPDSAASFADLDAHVRSVAAGTQP